MKQHHSTRNRLLSLLLCAAILIGLLPLGSVVADEGYTGVIADKDKGYGTGTLHAVPGALVYNDAFMKTYVYNGGKLCLNNRFKLVASSNYNGSSDRIPTGTMDGKKIKSGGHPTSWKCPRRNWITLTMAAKSALTSNPI